MKATWAIARELRFLAMLLLLVGMTLPGMAQCNLNGTWTGTAFSSFGVSGALTVTFFNSTTSTVNLTVTATDPFSGQATSETLSGTISGSSFTWHNITGQVAGSGTGSVSADCNSINGTYTATVSGDTDSGTYVLTRRGVTLSVAALTFPQSAIGGISASQGITVANGGSGSIALVAPTATQNFSASSSCPSNLSPGQNCTVNVTCTPTGAGILTGNVYVNSPTGPIGSAPLTCIGVQPLTGSTFIPQSGWWWDPKLNGDGLFLEYGGGSGGGIFLAIYTYDANGNSAWLVSAGGQVSGKTYTGPLLKESGGQPLLGQYQLPKGTQVGTISITFTDATDASMTITANGSSSTVTIQKFSFGASQTPMPGALQSGWWWGGQPFSGSGYAIEVQGNSFFAAAYSYDSGGNPVWYLTSGTLTNGLAYGNTWDLYAGGPQITSPEGNYGAHKVNSITAMTMIFADATHGNLVMGNVNVPLLRFQGF